MQLRTSNFHARPVSPWPAQSVHRRSVLCQAARKTAAVDPAAPKNGTTKGAAAAVEKEFQASILICRRPLGGGILLGVLLELSCLCLAFLSAAEEENLG